MAWLAQLVRSCVGVREYTFGVVLGDPHLVRDSDHLEMGKGDRMISLYTGTPGSGKSYDAARLVVQHLKRGKPLIANYPVNENCVKNPRSVVEYWDNSEMTPENFMKFAVKNHKVGKESQTLVIIDECQVLLNCRDFGRKDRNGWVNLFAQHRKLGYDFILITQNDRFIDKQVRCLVENEVKHRKLNNYGFGGLLLSLTMMTWFISITTWYGGNKAIIAKSLFVYNRKYENVYDSYRMFSDFGIKATEAAPAGEEVPGGTAYGGAPGELAGSAPAPEVVADDPEQHTEKRIDWQKIFPTYFKLKKVLS